MLNLGLGLCLSKRAARDTYAVAGFKPEFVLDFGANYARVDGAATTVADAITHSATSNGTMTDSDGLLKWRPHNLALNSATPATQSITVVSGADYTVECTGVSIALSGAGTGTVTEGNPVEITASTTTLTLTVTGSTGTMWAYRSDLGGMVNNPDRGDSYVPTTTAVYMPRRGNHIWNGSAWENAGVLHESEARTQLLHTTDALVTQSHTVTAVPHTLHFTGTGTVTLSGASTDGPLVGTGTGEENRVSLTFTPSAGSLTLTVSGTVTNAQLEVGSTPSSYIPNHTGSGTVTRAAETQTVAAANLPWPTPNALSIQMSGTMTYADTGSALEAEFISYESDSNNLIDLYLSTASSATGRVVFRQKETGASDVVETGGAAYSPGVNVPFNIASRHGSTFINGAVDGTALTANETPTALPDLASTDLQIGYDFMGNIKQVSIWAVDIGDAGIAEASD